MNRSTPIWGIRFGRPAAAAGGLPLIDAPLPQQLIMPLNQNIGFPARVMVETGEQILSGQPLADCSDTGPSARVHAPTSGTVIAIGDHPVPGRNSATCVFIETDGKDTPWPGYRRTPDPLQLSIADLRHAVTEAGLVGLGGAMFPTSIKLNPGLGVTTLILNGAECEPRISCDDALMQNDAPSVLQGARIMMRILEADNCIVAIKENSPSIEAMRNVIETLADDRFTLQTVPAVYPIGGENQLIEYLMGIEVPATGLPWDTGIICQNVGTAAAVADFFALGKPLVERIVTVCGEGVHQPVNIRTRLGTPISLLIESAGGYTAEATRLVMGGPMMGISLADDSLPVTKACNSIYVPGTAELGATDPEMPCIRCGECATVCPVNLTPQFLLQQYRSNNYERLQQLGIADCIECGCCDYVCPSRIPLTSEFRMAKRGLWEIGFEKRRARQAERRFAAREERLSHEDSERDRELNLQTKTIANPADADSALDELLQRTGVNDPQDGER